MAAPQRRLKARDCREFLERLDPDGVPARPSSSGTTTGRRLALRGSRAAGDRSREVTMSLRPSAGSSIWGVSSKHRLSSVR